MSFRIIYYILMICSDLRFVAVMSMGLRAIVLWMLLIRASRCESAGPDKFMTSRNLIRKTKFNWSPHLQQDLLNLDIRISRKKRSLPNAEDSKTALDMHNFLRSTIGDEGKEPIPANMMYMSWDPSLSLTSLIYARKCVFKHSEPYERSTHHFPGWNGENLWAGSGKFSGTSFNPEVGIKSWFMEYVDYDFHTHYCIPDKQCGHYTQIVWAESYKLGCAWVNCSKFDTTEGEIWTDTAYMVCHYAPGGNEDGVDLYKIGERCSQCYENDTCPDGKLCRNAHRDVILPIPTQPGYIFGIALCAVSVSVLLLVMIYFIHSRKNDFVKAWRNRKRISHREDSKANVEGHCSGSPTTNPDMLQ